MNMLDRFGFAAVLRPFFSPARPRTKFGRTLMFVLAALNLVFLLLGLFT